MQYKPREVKQTGVLYRIEWYKEISDQDILSLDNACRRYQKKYPNVSYLIGVSETSSDSAFKVYERTGKRGRPKTVVQGEKVKKHVHQCAVGSNGQSAYSFQKKVSRVLNNRAGKNVTKIVSTKGLDFISYILNQSASCRDGGDFDFKQCSYPFIFAVDV